MNTITTTGNLDVLANKLYVEVIDKARVEVESMTNSAQAQADEIIRNARVQSEEILANAKVEAERLKSMTEVELKLAGSRFMHDLKEKVSGLFVVEMQDTMEKWEQGKPLLSTLLKEIILKWTPDKIDEIQLSGDIYKQLNKNAREFLQTYNDKLVIGSVESGEELLVVKAKSGYELRFSDHSLKEYLKPYFSESLKALLFATDE